MLPRVVISSFICAVALATCPSSMIAGELRKLADKPLAIVYAKDINERSVARYMQDMSKRMEVGKSFSERIDSQLEKQTFTKTQTPVAGMLVYLVQGLVPGLEQITFQSVVDEAEARTIMNSQREMFGDQATLDEQNGVYRLTRMWESESEIPEGADVKEYDNKGPGYSNSMKVVERDGKRFQKYTGSFTQQYRYQDRLLYSNRADDFSTVKLPSSQEIFKSLEGDSDVGMKIYADRVPVGLRNMGWGMLSAMMGTQMQQQNSESDESAQMKQSAGNWGLSLLRSIMFDVDYGEGEGHLASDREPVRGRFNLRPRRNSSLIKQLDELGSGRSRFAPLLRDDAAFSVHVCLALPQEGIDTLSAIADWVKADGLGYGQSADQQAAQHSLARAINSIADDGTLEFIVRLVRSDTSGSVLLAGIQLADQPDQERHMATLVKAVVTSISSGHVESTQRFGRPLVHVTLPQVQGNPVNISDVWIGQRDGILWLAAGGKNSHDMIRQASERCATGRAVRTRLLTGKLDMEHWMSWPKKDPTKLAELPAWIDVNGAALAVLMGPSYRDGMTPSPLLEKVMACPGSKVGWLTLNSDKSGLTAEAEVGAPLADWFFARQIDSQEQYIARQQQKAKEAMEAADRKLKEVEQAVDEIKSTGASN